MSGRRIALGPQRPVPTVPELLGEIPGDGPVVAISAGWRLDEVEQPKVLEQLGVDVTHLPLYRWYEQIKRAELTVHREHADRQARVRAAKRHYQVRMSHALAAYREVVAEPVDDADIQERAELAALSHLREVDRTYGSQVDGFLRAGERDAWEGDVAATGHAHARNAILGARAVLVAGGHVGVLHTRMHFFGLPGILTEAVEAGTALIAWSAGAMALSDRIVLYDDESPSGSADPELFGNGFGLLPGAVFLPYASQRLDLEDGDRVARFARRFGPTPCIGLEPGAAVEFVDGRWVGLGDRSATPVLRPDGVVAHGLGGL